MSQFLSSLLGEAACNVDGTVSGSNPIAALAQRMLDTSGLGAGAVSALGGAAQGEQGSFAYYDAPPGAMAMQQPWALGGGDAGLEAAWSQQQGMGMGMGMGMDMGMGMGGDPQMMMHMQQMQMQMHHQHLMAMMQQRQMQEMAMMQQQQRQQQEQQEQQQWEAAQSEKQKGEIERAIEATMNGNEPLTVERLEDIWQSFGVASEAQQELLGAAGSAKQASYPEGASAEGYKEAWNKIAARLESPPAETYAFAAENKFVAPASASLSASASASAAAAASSSASASEALRALLDRGHALFASGCVSEAVLAFEAAVQQDDGCDEGWRMLGKCHAESDEDKKAILALQRAVDCDPYNLESLLALGTSYVNELDSVKALETLKAWVKHNPAFSGFEARADAYSDGSLMDEVTQLMLAAAEHSPQSADVHVVLGVLYNLSLDFSSAADHLNRALVLRAGGGYADKNKLGATLANANRSAEAVSLYVEALSLRPTFARGWLNLGISFANLNRYSDAAKAYVQALHLNPHAGHIWGYLRVVLTCQERLDLVEKCGAVNRVSLEASRQATSAMAAELGLDLINEPSAPPA